jgi:hypothetical protein
MPRDRSEKNLLRERLNVKGKIFESMPFKPMQFISHYATIGDQCRLACTSKTMLKKVIEQEDIWRIKVIKRYEIRAGYLYIKNENLLRMDTEMQEIQKDALKILLKGKWKQKLLIIIWFLCFLFMALIVFPTLLIIDEEGVDIPLPVLFLPFTI